MPLLDTVAAAVRRERLIPDGAAVLIALSGGADSMALLHAMRALAPAHGWRLAAAHVNHGLRGDEAERDEAFAREWCARWSVPLHVMRADVAAEAAARGEGLEETGRRIRYAFFNELCACEGYDRIATAHTASDNVETLLLHLARGSGVRGLGGIRPLLGRRIRPLLDVTREEVEAYCRENAVPFVTDSTNFDTAYCRNLLRHEAVPALRRVNPRLEEAAGRLARAARRDDDCLETLAAALLDEARLAEDVFDPAPLAAAHEALRLRALRRLAGEEAEERHAAALDTLLTVGGSVNLPGGRTALLADGRLQIRPAAPRAAVPYFEWTIRPGERCEICGRIYQIACVSLEEYEKKKKIHKNLLKNTVNYDKISGDLVVRQRLPGDAYHPMGRQGGKSLKKLFNEAKIPPEIRDTIPILCDSAGILLAYGCGCDERVRPDESTRRFLIITVEDGR